LLVIYSIVFSGNVAANQENNKNPEYVLKIGTMDLIPYGWMDDKQLKQGIIYDLNQEIGERLKMPFTNKIYPFKRMLKRLKSGKIDLISSQAHQESIEAGEKLSVQHNIDVIVGTTKKSNIQSIADLKDRHLVYHLSASYIELEGLPASVTRVNNYRQSLISLYKNRNIDAAVFSEPAYYYWMKELDLKQTDFGKVILLRPNKNQWIFVRSNLPAYLKSKIKKVVEDIYQENLYNELLVKYGKEA